MSNNTINILDTSSLMPGPFATLLLQKHLNATVVKIEDINQPDPLINMRPTKNGIGLGYSVLNKDKSVLKVDMRKDGIEKIKNIVKNSGLFIENFKPGRAFKLGMGFDDLIKINPNLIYCSISGYPTDHPMSGKSAHDLNILSLSGYLDQQTKLGHITSLPPLLLADMFTAYHTAIRIMASLLKNEHGIHLKISMYECFLETMMFNNYPQLELDKDFSSVDYIMSGGFPCYAMYQAKDGGNVTVAALERPLWIDFCHHMAHEEWIDKQFEPKLMEKVASEMQKYDRYYWLNKDFDFCVTPVLSITESAKRKYV